MLIPIHAQITRKALEKYFDPKVLNTVIRSNQKQDTLQGQIGHSDFHFDNNKITESQVYLQKQRNAVFTWIEKVDLRSAWMAFGRLLHSAQDLYAHSNYVSLWLGQFDDFGWPSVDEIDPMDDLILSGSKLKSGKLYYPFEILSFVPLIKNFIIPLLPRDSHAWMNLDSPASGKKFAYAFSAAVKRTVVEFDVFREGLTVEKLNLFING
ncbi:MAG: hypothetical protein A2X25_14030 [Chloroflexi bacterium GWB2_49_20]|nr:MAG: hypothetical protein A2X25_14030 [Chloroflexi bacterium GWB2_49_20]OGN79908.1 MAG: hypothetical protein A2X26_02720 [Chloroflexi bacterium GWC2_49_37]OGN85557.1 MAG: hypothetical protein A2X27_04340 [Chloroflexi bacterium GWD2_49_16]HBG74433.1 hypothetical protein [Anaerolineae bacterium]HCC79600.1 hypothetical protein [Anaerolineae bacterium]